MSRVLVTAKAPVPGAVKTRLGVDIGMDTAARVAAASLLDTLDACAAAYPAGRRYLALSGDLRTAVQAAELVDSLTGWEVFPQVGTGFAHRLAHAHATVAARGEGPVVQIGMDTPQVTPELLLEVEAALQAPPGPDAATAALGPAEDGGWWVLGLRDGRGAAALHDVPMSEPTTYVDTRAALTAAGERVVSAAVLRDVDTVADADAVADLAPGGRFAAVWSSWRDR